jgi:hypothetical protein
MTRLLAISAIAALVVVLRARRERPSADEAIRRALDRSLAKPDTWS